MKRYVILSRVAELESQHHIQDAPSNLFGKVSYSSAVKSWHILDLSSILTGTNKRIYAYTPSFKSGIIRPYCKKGNKWTLNIQSTTISTSAVTSVHHNLFKSLCANLATAYKNTHLDGPKSKSNSLSLTMLHKITATLHQYFQLNYTFWLLKKEI